MFRVESPLPAAANEARRDECLREVLAPLAAQATAYARGDEYLADELAQHVLTQYARGRYDPRRAPLPVWAAAVMRHYRASYFRSRALAPGGDGPYPERTDPRNDIPALDLRIDLATPFGAADVARVRGWPPRRQVILLSWHLLWRKLPAGMWSEALAAVGLARPFPGAGFEDWPGADRTTRLAEALGVRRNTILQTLARGRGDLRQLRFVQELAGP